MRNFFNSIFLFKFTRKLSNFFFHLHESLFAALTVCITWIKDILKPDWFWSQRLTSSDGTSKGKCSNPVSNYRHAIKNKLQETMLPMKFRCNLQFQHLLTWLKLLHERLKEMMFIITNVNERDEGDAWTRSSSLKLSVSIRKFSFLFSIC